MLCWAAGGPQRYSGRSMEESHRDLAITPGEWQAFMDDVQTTLDKFSVPLKSRLRLWLRAHKPQLSFLARKGRAIHDNGQLKGGITTGQNLQRSWSLRNPSLEGHERRRLAAIAGWPRGNTRQARNPAGEALKARARHHVIRIAGTSRCPS